MKHVLALLLILCGLTALVQAAEKSSEATARDRQGFLAVPTSDLPATPAPAAAAAQAAATPAPIPASSNAPDASARGYLLDDKHKLLSGDRVSFQIVEDRTNSVPLMVAESAELDVPYIGRVSVAGKTCKQAAEDIKVALERDYYYKATVIIGLDSLTKVLGKVYVFGPVRNPGPVEIPANENFTVSKAIMRCGGFGDFANRRAVQIVRKSEAGNRTFTVNLVNVIEKGQTEGDITLEPEDFIIVPQRAFNL